MSIIKEGKLFGSEGELSPFNNKLVKITIQAANLLGLPENRFISFDESNNKINLSPASAYFGRETQDALCNITQQALNQSEDVDYGNFITTMQSGVKRKLEKDSDNETLIAADNQIGFLLEHMGNFDGDKVEDFNDHLSTISKEVKRAFTNFNINLFFIDQGLGQRFFNPCIGIASRQIISQAAVKMALGKFDEKRMFNEVIIPVKQTLRHVAGHELKLNKEWRRVADGGRGHFDRRTAKRQANLDRRDVYSQDQGKSGTVGPGRHEEKEKT